MKSWCVLIVSLGLAIGAAPARSQGELAPPTPVRNPVELVRPAPVIPKTLSPEQAVQARNQIMAWLECEECSEGELEAVVKLGNIAVPTLGATLKQGPSAASREELRQHLVDTHQKLGEYARTHPEGKVSMSEDQYVKTYMDNYVALYGVRSAQALAAIGGAEANKHLQTALKYELRADVRAVVADSLKRASKQ